MALTLTPLLLVAPLVSVMAPKEATWPTFRNPDIDKLDIRRPFKNRSSKPHKKLPQKKLTFIMYKV